MIEKTSVVLACALALASCSSDDDDSSAPVAGGTATENQAEVEPMLPGEGAPTLDDEPGEDDIDAPIDDAPVDAPGSVSQQLLTPAGADGSINTFWSCDDQNEQTVFELVFFADASGAIALSEDDIRDMSWQESPVGSVLMSVDSQGDSMIQSVAFLDDEDAFTATDSSIAGTSFGPVTCFLDGVEEDDTVIEGPGPSDDPQTARNEAIEESLNENDGTESSADVILGSIVNSASDVWSCQSGAGNAYRLTFAADQSGAVSVNGQSLAFNWEVPVEAAGLVLMSVQSSSDSAIAGLSLIDANTFIARLVRFSDNAIDSAIGGQASCSRTTG